MLLLVALPGAAKQSQLAAPHHRSPCMISTSRALARKWKQRSFYQLYRRKL